MDDPVIGLIAAMPNEIRPLLRLAGPVAKEQASGFALYRFAIDDRKVILIESGMGPERAATATALLIDRAAPSVLVNFGFAGAVTAGPRVGDVIVAEHILLHRGRLFSEQPGLARELTERVVGTVGNGDRERDCRTLRGTFITAAEILQKRVLAGLLPTGTSHPVVEMESAAVARIAAREGVPLVALRAISDGAEEELGFAIDEFTDREMRIRAGKVLLTIAKKPWIIPQLVRLARNARLAGQNLALAVRDAVSTL